MTTALVTGAAGFIGSHLCAHLANKHSLRVVGLDDLSGGDLDNVPSNVTLVTGSVSDASVVRSVFEEYRPAHVYHLAAYAAEGLSHFIRRFNYSTNLIGSVTVLNESIRHGVETLVFTSSIAVYGQGQVPLTEETVPVPEDPYGIAKYAFELDLQAACKLFGQQFVVFRPHNVYGEHQNIADKYRNVVGIFMNQILRGQPMTIFGDGTQMRAFSYVADIIEPIAASAWTPAARGRVFNIGARTGMSVLELAHAIRIAMGAPNHPIVHLPPREEVHIALADHHRVTQTFGVQPETPLEEGLARMVSWVRTVGARETKAFRDIELTQGLPPSWQPGRQI